MGETRLEELREENNLKAKEVAKALNIAESTYSEWEHNKIPIPTKRIIEIANFYNVNIDYLLILSNIKISLNSKDINLELIGNRLKEIRQELNLSLRELGEKLNTAFSSLASYERGECLIQSDILISLCRESNYSIDWVLGRSKDKYIK